MPGRGGGGGPRPAPGSGGGGGPRAPGSGGGAGAEEGAQAPGSGGGVGMALRGAFGSGGGVGMGFEGFCGGSATPKRAETPEWELRFMLSRMFCGTAIFSMRSSASATRREAWRSSLRSSSSRAAAPCMRVRRAAMASSCTPRPGSTSCFMSAR